jgi:peptidyl-prolyl cis-trans isomerase C
MTTIVSFTTFAMVLATATMLGLAGCDQTNTTTGAPAAPAQSDEAKPAEGDGAVIATFGKEQFTDQELRAEMDRLNRRSRQALEDKDRLRQFVENHVLSRLIYNEGTERGFDKDPEVRKQIEDLERRLVIQKVMQEHQTAPVTDEEVKAYYDAHPEEFTTDRVKASHILVKDEALAKEIKEKLAKDPSQFDALAKEHSIDRSNSSKGGDLGFFGRGRMVKEFDDVAFALTEDGQIAEIVSTRFGYHIVKRTGREDGTPKNFDEVKNQIRIRLINDKRRTQTEQFLNEIKQDAGLKLDDQALASFDVMKGAPPEGAEPAQPMVGGH